MFSVLLNMTREFLDLDGGLLDIACWIGSLSLLPLPPLDAVLPYYCLVFVDACLLLPHISVCVCVYVYVCVCVCPCVCVCVCVYVPNSEEQQRRVNVSSLKYYVKVLINGREVAKSAEK